jgi:CMP-N,N'-diacetyllegionaminic acid synthase
MAAANNLAIVIARGGSKGFANKNLQHLMGRPLVAWTLEHALSSQRVDEVILSSDSPGILEVGRQMGVRVYERPAELASDSATVDAAARHGVLAWEAERGRQCRYAAILYGNIPLRPADLTDRALTKLIETEADSVQSVYPVGKNHPYWMKTLTGDFHDRLGMYQPNHIYRRQDLPPVYMLDGGVIAVTRASLFRVVESEPHAFLGCDRRGVVTSAGEVVDVDEEVDMIYAEALLKRAGRR